MALCGGAYATIAAKSSNTINGCYAKHTGALRVLTKGHCHKGERALAWNKRGIRGLPGATGAPGAPGAPGRNGTNGTDGAPGTPATKLFAQVNADGTLNAGSPGVTSTDGGTHFYYVNFGQDVSHCSVQGTQGGIPIFGISGGLTGRNVGPAIVDIFAPGADLAPGFPSATTVEVETFSGTTAADSSFTVAAFC
jgi:hypothetical protein